MLSYTPEANGTHLWVSVPQRMLWPEAMVLSVDRAPLPLRAASFSLGHVSVRSRDTTMRTGFTGYGCADAGGHHGAAHTSATLMRSMTRLKRLPLDTVCNSAISR